MRDPLAVGEKRIDLPQDLVSLRVLDPETSESGVEFAGLIGRDFRALGRARPNVTIAGHQDEQAEETVGLASEEVLEGGRGILRGVNRDLDRSLRRVLHRG